MSAHVDESSRMAAPRAGWTAGLIHGSRDLEGIIALLQASFVNPWTRAMLEREIEQRDVSRIYVLRSDDETLVAFCSTWVIGDELHINNLAVRHADRRKGAATYLLRYVLDDVARRGVRRATLEVRESNEPARRLYDRLGFVVAGRRQSYYRAPSEDALILWYSGATEPRSGGA